ncbi:hypothetical protein OG741_23025 [Streptomyces sp. NBC_01410]|uniref:hypothetical protein n=1 Tax=Streptomyces sp. NBC_01410 TaxID=2903856 RepID=UPI0032532FC9
MTWWLKARAAAAFFATALITACGGLLFGETDLPIPVLTGQSGSFLVGHLITVLPAAMLMYGLSRTDTRMESVAVRPIPLWNTALGMSAATLTVLAALLLYLVSYKEIAVVMGRNTAGYIGFAMLVSAFLGPRIAAVITAAVPLICAATGWTAAGQPEPWAWILQPARSSSAVIAAMLVLVAGAAATSGRRAPIEIKR